MLSLILKILILLFQKHPNVSEFFNKVYLGTLFIGLASLGISLFLGDLALDDVKAQACDLTSIYYHEEMAYFSLYWFLGTGLMECLRLWKKNILFEIICFVFIFISCIQLFKTAKQGAELVFENGVGVKNSSCENK